jgi:ABC transport system ATP-binding/permease protein
MTTRTRRYVRVIASDRGYLTFMVLLPIVLGALIRLIPTAPDGLAGPPGKNNQISTLLLILVICACLSGTASSIRELVKERPIYIRERAAGLSSGAYLFSKLLVLGVISIVQSFLLVLLGVAGRSPMPAHGAFLTGAPLIEIMLGIAVLAVASMCLGLLVSALVSTSEKAMPFLVLLTMAQVILSGGVLLLTSPLTYLAAIAPSRWGYAAVATTVDYDTISPPAVFGTIIDPLWKQSSGNWLRDMGLMIGLAAVFSVLTWIQLRRIGPRRRKG